MKQKIARCGEFMLAACDGTGQLSPIGLRLAVVDIDETTVACETRRG
jgi:hypothetical protein